MAILDIYFLEDQNQYKGIQDYPSVMTFYIFISITYDSTQNIAAVP